MTDCLTKLSESVAESVTVGRGKNNPAGTIRNCLVAQRKCIIDKVIEALDDPTSKFEVASTIVKEMKWPE